MEEKKEIPVVKPTSIEQNDLLEFDIDNKKLGSEMIKIYVNRMTTKGLEFKIITRPDIINIFPVEYVSYVCNNLGAFLMDSVKYLGTVESEENEEPPFKKVKN
jgi:hypothetical protein